MIAVQGFERCLEDGGQPEVGFPSHASLAQAKWFQSTDSGWQLPLWTGLGGPVFVKIAHDIFIVDHHVFAALLVSYYGSIRR